MNKFSVLACAGLAVMLTGCQATKGTVTPLKEGYIAEASVNNGDEKEAQKIALYTAEEKCKQFGKDFYVMEQVNQSKNEFEMDDTTSDITNAASQLLLGRSTIEQERTVRLKFDCK
ncbi:TPA: hypothetical protein ACRZ4F_003112 [Vibrio harveyi]|uniref:hypothetical protein n=1 Tax=Vibrio harveyi TaxID=669 RepID=UPI0002E2002B|nr:hypothetical protein [Vibrio harveyi]